MLKSTVTFKRILKSIPFYSFSNDKKPHSVVDQVHKEILSKINVEKEAVREFTEKKEKALAEVSGSFYDLEIKMELYYEHNKHISNYVKAVMDFSDINFIPVS